MTRRRQRQMCIRDSLCAIQCITGDGSSDRGVDHQSQPSGTDLYSGIIHSGSDVRSDRPGMGSASGRSVVDSTGSDSVYQNDEKKRWRVRKKALEFQGLSSCGEWDLNPHRINSH